MQPLASTPVTVYESDAAAINGVPSKTLPVHVYVDAPPPVKTRLSPRQAKVLYY
jgi:hypothetical protein